MRRLPRPPRIAANYFVLAGAELFSKALAAVTFAYLARVLGPQNYGHLEFVLAFIVIFTLVADSGMSSYGARELAKEPQLAGQLLVHILFARVILAAVAALCLLILASLLNQPPVVRSLLVLYTLTLVGFPGLIQWFYQGRDQMHVVALASLARWSIFSLGIFLFVRGEQQIGLVPVIETGAILCTAVLLAAILKGIKGLPRARLYPRHAFMILWKAMPIGASELVWAVKVYFATILLGLFIGGSEVGWFAAAHRVVISLHAFVWLYFYNLLPVIARKSQGKISQLEGLMKTSLQITAWSAVLLGVFGSLFAKTGLTLLYGPQYAEAAPVFRVLIWVLPLTLLSGHYRYTLIGYDRQALEFTSSLIGAAANIILNLTLIPVYGLLGAAWSFVLSEAVIWLAAYLFVRRTITHIPLLPALRLPLLAGILLLGTLYLLLPINLWLASSGAFMVYLAVFLALQPRIVTVLRSYLSGS